jgi:cyclase
MPSALPARRIIPCLDVKDGRVVKGVQFCGHRDAGDIIEQAMRYRDEGADELVFYDISASAEGRSLSRDWVRKVASVLDIPFAVAGGLRGLEEAAACLAAGADKISVNSPALERPELITELAREFGNQCVVLGVDTFASGRDYVVYQYTGRPDRSRETGRRTLDWVREAVDRGAGEVVLNCMRHDGVRSGYDIGHTRAVVEALSVPVIASGGAGTPEHFLDAFEAGASGALAASVFHDRLIAIPDLKEFLGSCGIEVRP